MKMADKRLFIVAAIAIAAVLTVSGCTGTKTYGDTLSGRDIFDPSVFSMAVYSVTINDTANVTHEGLIITAFPNDKDGERLASVVFSDNNSTRADAWINHGVTDKVLVSDIQGNSVQVDGGNPMFNLTVFDQAWNTLDSTYSLLGMANITTSAGQFNGSYVYGADKVMISGGNPVSIQVMYFMNPLSSVPVMYMAKYPTGTAVYELQSVYGPHDKDSTPERAVQALFDSLDKGNYDAAARYWVTYDAASGKFKPLDRQMYDNFVADMTPVYGKNGGDMDLQYVYTYSVQPAGKINSYDAVIARYVNVQYDPAQIYAYTNEGNFSMVDIGGSWRFIA